METKKYIIFKLNGQSFGVEVQQVISIEKYQSLTMVPGTVDFIKGIMPLRGEITPVLDLKERLSMKQTDITEDHRILIIHMDEIQLGLIVDDATEVIDIDSSMIEPPTSIIRGVDQEYISGIANNDHKLLILLDLEKITNQKEIEQLEQTVLDQHENNQIQQVVVNKG